MRLIAVLVLLSAAALLASASAVEDHSEALTGMQAEVEAETEAIIDQAISVGRGLCRNANGDIFTCPKAAPAPKVVTKRVVVVKKTAPKFFAQAHPTIPVLSRRTRKDVNGDQANRLGRLLHRHRVEAYSNNRQLRRLERRQLLSQHIAQLKALHDRHERELARMKARQMEEVQALDLQLSHEKHSDQLALNGHVHKSIQRPGVRRIRAERFD